MLFERYKTEARCWLLKALPGGPVLVPIKPRLYLKDNREMKQFAEDFKRSYEAPNELQGVEQLFYCDDKELEKLLEKEEAPAAVLYFESEAGMVNVKGKYDWKHQFLGMGSVEAK